jgi:hypothetical protein
MGAGLVSAVTGVAAESIRETRPNAVYGELGGRGLILSANYERWIQSRMGVGAGIFGVLVDDDGFYVLPVYLSFASGDTHSLYLSTGITFHSGGDDDPPLDGSFGTVSVGYQLDTDAGLMVRPTATFMFAGGSSLLWPGVAVGGRF